MCRLSVFLFGILFFLLSCGTSHRKAVTVSAAMSLKDAFTEIGSVFNKMNEKSSVRFNFASSGTLARQIESGAPADVYASASVKEMNRLQNRKLIDAATRFDFSGNCIVAVAPEKSRLVLKSTEALCSSGLKKVAVGNPRTVPAGRYAMQGLEKAKSFGKVKASLVLCEHVRQVLDYAARGEVDAAFVYATDFTARRKKVRLLFRMPASSHKPIIYPAALVKKALNRTGGLAFLKFLKSKTAKAVLKKHGFLIR